MIMIRDLLLDLDHRLTPSIKWVKWRLRWDKR